MEGIEIEEIDSKEERSKEMNVFQKVSRVLGDIFVPIIPVLVATGLFMGLRSLIVNLGVELNLTFELLYIFLQRYQLFLGITESAIFGVSLRFIKPFIFGLVGGNLFGCLITNVIGMVVVFILTDLFFNEQEMTGED